MRLLICSNSGPAPILDPGAPLRPAAAGGLVPHILALLLNTSGEWFFRDDRAGLRWPPQHDGRVVLHPVSIDRHRGRLHYETISIETLLWLFHYLHDTSSTPAFDSLRWRAWEAYADINHEFARRVVRTARGCADKTVVLVNDYHLLLVPGAMTTLGIPTQTRVIYVHHVPWCEPDYFRILPSAIGMQILTSMLSADTVTFHCTQWRNAFMRCCDKYLKVQITGEFIDYAGHRTRLVVVPFPLDSPNVLQLLRGEGVARWRQRIEDLTSGRRLVVRVDRLDLWKNQPRGFLAYAELLRRHPNLVSEFCFVAVAAPPRYRSARHQEYEATCRAIVADLNNNAGRDRPRPVELLVADKPADMRDRAIAALSRASAVLVNPTYDGFNLVAKEGVLVGESPAILLSATAGAHEYLGPAVTTVDPFDVSGTADELEAAIVDGTRPEPTRALTIRDSVRADNPERWLSAVLGEDVSQPY